MCGTITVTWERADDNAKRTDEREKRVIFKNDVSCWNVEIAVLLNCLSNFLENCQDAIIWL